MSRQIGMGGTDLGRRITEERESAGLSRTQAAERAGMAPDYLTYLETSPSPSPTHATITRLASALGTLPGTLTGAGMEAPPGRGAAGRRRALQEMTVEESRSHLAPGGVGRFLYDADRGPVAVPVNYAMLGDDVIFKADKQTATAAAAAGQHKVSFDVDHIDDALDEGWSVLLSGTASVLTSPADREAAEQLGIQSWANIDGGSYVRLVPDLITGRRIRVSAAR